MNTILNLLSGAVDVVHYYARELCVVLLAIALVAGGDYLLHVAKQSQDTQRAMVNAITHPQSGATSAPAPEACGWLKTDGTNTSCTLGSSTN